MGEKGHRCIIYALVARDGLCGCVGVCVFVYKRCEKKKPLTSIPPSKTNTHTHTFRWLPRATMGEVTVSFFFPPLTPSPVEKKNEMKETLSFTLVTGKINILQPRMIRLQRGDGGRERVKERNTLIHFSWLLTAAEPGGPDTEGRGVGLAGCRGHGKGGREEEERREGREREG